MNNTETQEGGFVDEIFDGKEAYEDTPPPTAARDFLPWHRPRKQFVRHKQWHGEIDALLTDSPLTDGPLTYLGLPGVDLLDLRHFQRTICEPKKLELRFLGFNSNARPNTSEHEQMNISLDEVRRLPLVSEMSEIIGDNFVMLSRDRSLACVRTRFHGPFDVINLDLCDGFGKQSPTRVNDTYYNAISALLGLQQKRSRPWLLFLTTRTDQPTVDAEVLGKLVTTYLSNLEKHTSFRNESAEKFSIDNEPSLRTALASSTGHLRVFLTGLSKWLINLALEGRPPTIVDLRSAMGYRVAADSDTQDLVSLAFRFTPTFDAIPDPAGLVTLAVTPPNEGDLAAKALCRIAKMRDIDSLLTDQVPLRQEMIDDTANLLELARYDGDAYRDWVANGEGIAATA